MSWIKVIGFKEASGSLKRIYDRVAGRDGNIDNVLTVHSLRPHSLTGHMTLYKNVLHHSDNTLPKWYLETIGVYVSHLNKCEYCVKHHFEGLKKLRGKYAPPDIYKAVKAENFSELMDQKEVLGLHYAKVLTLVAHDIDEQQIEALRQAGYDDGEILEINQVVSYFNYVNRTVLGLGVNAEGDILGLSPKGEDWMHH